MPLVLPESSARYTYFKDKKGIDVLNTQEASEQKIRPLRIGLLNMMPTGVLDVTETQFMHPIHKASQTMQINPIFLKLDGINYGDDRDNPRKYNTTEDIKKAGLDALIITGANVEGYELSQEDFYKPLAGFMRWAEKNVTSTIHSCLAKHAYMEIMCGIKRQPVLKDKVPRKMWGNYKHWVTNIEHPLTNRLSKEFYIAHSRHNEITWQDHLKAGHKILAFSNKAGVGLATSPDGIKSIFFQAHPEYYDVSLLKEYIRQLNIEQKNRINYKKYEYPPTPDNYFDERGMKLITSFSDKVKNGFYDDEIRNNEKGFKIPKELEEQIVNHHLLHKGFSVPDHIISNWITLVYQITGFKRKEPYMKEINSEDPLGLLEQSNTLYSQVYYYKETDKNLEHAI